MEHTEEGGGLSLIKVFLGLANLGAEWVMWLLIGMLFLGVVIVFERLWLFNSTRVNVTRVARAMLKHLGAGELSRVQDLVKTGKSMEERVLSDALGVYEQGADAVEEMAAASLIRERQRYDRSIAFLGIVGGNGPFIGLLGTVIGIILSFAELGRNPKGGLEVVGPGISEALVATAVGLLAAIPAVITFNWLKGMVKRRVGNTEFLCKLLISHLKGEHNSGPKARPSGIPESLDEGPNAPTRAQTDKPTEEGTHGRALEFG
jgi:biopolymer transport protein TolQ